MMSRRMLDITVREEISWAVFGIGEMCNINFLGGLYRKSLDFVVPASAAHSEYLLVTLCKSLSEARGMLGNEK